MKIPFPFYVFLFAGIFSACHSDSGVAIGSGSFEANEITVSSEFAGKIISLSIEEGDTLQHGQIVGQIDSLQLYLQKMSLLANQRGVNVQRPNIATQSAPLEEQIAQLKNERIRVETLVRANAANKKQLDDIESQIKILENQLTATLSQLNKSAAHINASSSVLDIQIAQLDEQLQKSTIQSPMHGVVLSKYLSAGELSHMGSPLFKIANLDTLLLRAYVTGEDLTLLKLNDSVNVFADYGKEMKRYMGRLIWIADKSEFTPKTIQTRSERSNLVYAVKIKVANDGYLKVGMYGEVRVKP